jgi:SulP family sulfate permease
VKVVELVRRDDGKWETKPAPESLTSNQITVIQIYGNLYFADVYSADDMLPSYEGITNAVLIYSQRGRESIDFTRAEYVQKLSAKYQQSGNRLMLCDVEKNVMKQMQDGELIEAIGEDNVLPIQHLIGGSIQQAYERADNWIQENKPR